MTGNRKAKLSTGVLALVLCAAALRAAQSSPVRTRDGLVSGRVLSHGREVFKGIPFAAPPVGKLRWRPPEPAAPWPGVRPADHFGPPCMQPASPKRLGPWTRVFLSDRTPSEDCLYLNIWTTEQRPASPLPVMVWIYGGGFTSGAGSVAVYDGAALARRGVVVVNFNYRLGPLGFLAYPALTQESPHHSSGNYALLDQIAALGWVERNIARFGGDPHNVTIFGQSAGAFSVWALVQSPLAQGLFERAVIMSGEAVIPVAAPRSLAEAEQQGEELAARLGVHSLEQLRALPAEKILQQWHGLSPIFDGWVLRPGWHPRHEVSLINGMVADDIGIGYYGDGPPPATTLKTYHHSLRELCGDQSATCRKLYPAANDQQAAAALRTALEDRARVSLYQWAEQQAEYSPAVYLYYFDRKIPWPQHPQYGVFHSSELPYVFDNLRVLRRPWQPVDWRVAEELSGYWTNFAKTGTPNGTGLPHWHAFESKDFGIMQLGAHMKPMPLSSPDRLRFWMNELEHPLGF